MREAHFLPVKKDFLSEKSSDTGDSRMSYTTGCSDSQSYHISFPATPGTSPDKADNDILHQIHWRYATGSHPDAFRTFLPTCGRSLPLFLCIPVRYNSDYVFHRTDSSPSFHSHAVLPGTYQKAISVLHRTVWTKL